MYGTLLQLVPGTKYDEAVIDTPIYSLMLSLVRCIRFHSLLAKQDSPSAAVFVNRWIWREEGKGQVEVIPRKRLACKLEVVREEGQPNRLAFFVLISRLI
jgi:hypothetical protein